MTYDKDKIREIVGLVKDVKKLGKHENTPKYRLPDTPNVPATTELPPDNPTNQMLPDNVVRSDKT